MANSTLASMTTVLSMNNTKFKKGLQNSQKSLTGFQKQMQALKGMILGTFAIAGVIQFGRSSFQALDTQRKAEAALLTALKGKENIQRSLIQQAKDLQRVTLFGDEETIRAQSLIAAFTNEEATIKRLIPLVQDFATAKQMSLAGAADLVSKTIGSSTNALSRYGIQVTGAVGSSERLESLVRGLSNAFEGQAVAAAKADTSLTQLKNAFGDFKETVAAVIVPTGTVRDYIKSLGSEDISTWDKFLSFFDVTKAAEITAVADAINSVMTASPGGTAGFFENQPDGAGASRPLAKILGMPEDVKLPDLISDLEWFGKTVFEVEGREIKAGDAAAKHREQMQYFQDILNKTSSTIKKEFIPSIDITRMSMAELASLWERIQIMPEGFAKTAASIAVSAQSLKTTMADIGASIKMELIQNISALGDAMGRAFAGMQGALKDLALSILDNIGYILMMAGLYLMPINPAAGLGLLLAGGAIQLGSGIFKGLGNKASNVNGGVGGAGQVEFKISGKNLVGVMDRQNNYTGMNT